MFIVKKLFVKNENEFTIPILTVKEVNLLIKNAKKSWTLNYDDISMNVLKKVNKIISPHLTHLYNNMTITCNYPSIYPSMPILKPNKDKFNISSYRPINILHPIDKLYQ